MLRCVQDHETGLRNVGCNHGQNGLPRSTSFIAALIFDPRNIAALIFDPRNFFSDTSSPSRLVRNVPNFLPAYWKIFICEGCFPTRARDLSFVGFGGRSFHSLL